MKDLRFECEIRFEICPSLFATVVVVVRGPW